MKKAIALICYGRLDYLQSVLASIQRQTCREAFDLYLFQDGLRADESAAGRDSHRHVRDYIGDVSSAVSAVTQEKNLGIALHYDFVEKLLFRQQGYDFVVFCEDDLILADGYLAVLKMMAEKFHDDPRVGMMAAHPDDPTAPLPEQWKGKDRYTSMGHNWAFGMSRSFWERRQPFVECYLDLVRKVPYQERPSAVIMNWLKRCGFVPTASSQDYVKSCATYALGGIKLSTYPNFGLPIGRIGTHFTPELFSDLKFDQSVVFDGQLESVSDLPDSVYRALWSEAGHTVGAKRVRVISDPGRHSVEVFEREMLAGKYKPSIITLLRARLRRTIGRTLRASLGKWRPSNPANHRGIVEP